GGMAWAFKSLKLTKKSRLLLAVAIPTVITVGGRALGYKFGGNTVVRCRQGHLFTMLWVPGVKFKSLDLGIARFQRCPVGRHWSLVVPVRDRDLTDAQRREAQAHRVYLS
ncbi:MAG: hypothetical protein J2P58_15365, partial [Acidimicrobiaceae bacterium]|nr:hypothetical protein [Acidimicrobiaceae bacterium]